MSEPVAVINTVLADLGKLAPDKKEKLLVACSGGADSMALLFCAIKAGYEVVVVHALHDMRPIEEAGKDRDLVKKFCDDNFLEYFELDICLQKLPLYQDKTPSEGTYRTHRHKKIWRLACELNISYVLTGHHADDQLETMIMKLCRGSGLRGLSGIAEKVNYKAISKSGKMSYIRPLLRISKEEIYKICKLNNIPFNEDKTNEETYIVRNKIRHEVIPVLKSVFPNCAALSSNSAFSIASAQEVIEDELYRIKRFQEENAEMVRIPIEFLQSSKDVVIYEWLRSSFDHLITSKNNSSQFDAINYTLVKKVISSIRNRQKNKFSWPQGIVVRVNKQNVSLEFDFSGITYEKD